MKVTALREQAALKEHAAKQTAEQADAAFLHVSQARSKSSAKSSRGKFSAYTEFATHPFCVGVNGGQGIHKLNANVHARNAFLEYHRALMVECTARCTHIFSDFIRFAEQNVTTKTLHALAFTEPAAYALRARNGTIPGFFA